MLEAIGFFPSGSAEQARQKSVYASIEQDLATPAYETPAVGSWSATFRSLGQRRNTIYEPAIAARVSSYSHGFKEFAEVRPDLIQEEYKPCAVTSAKTSGEINGAIKRTCHAVEFTSFLGHQMSGLEAYLLGKVERYALLLESV